MSVIKPIPAAFANYEVNSEQAAELMGMDTPTFVDEHAGVLPGVLHEGELRFDYYDVLNYSMRRGSRRAFGRMVIERSFGFVVDDPRVHASARSHVVRMRTYPFRGVEQHPSFIRIPDPSRSLTQFSLLSEEGCGAAFEGRLAVDSSGLADLTMEIELTGYEADLPASIQSLCEEFLSTWTYQIIPDRMRLDRPVLEKMRVADCFTCTKVMADRLSAIGVRTRPVVGLVLGPICQIHSWLEARIEQEWISIDVSLPLIARAFMPDVEPAELRGGITNHVFPYVSGDKSVVEYQSGDPSKSVGYGLTLVGVSDTSVRVPKVMRKIATAAATETPNPNATEGGLRQLTQLMGLRLNDDDRKRMMAASAACEGRSLPSLFDECLARDPHRPAILDEDRGMDLRSMADLSGGIARMIQDVLPDEERIALALPSGPLLVCTIIACLRLGRVCVMLDVNLPARRLDVLLGSVDDPPIITERAFRETFQARRCVSLDVDALGDERQETPATGCAADGGFIFFTSGSSGTPKAVYRNHRSCLAGQLPDLQFLSLGDKDRMLVTAQPSSIRIISEIFWPLLQGAPVVFAEGGKAADPHYLAGMIRQYDVTVLNIVPSQLELMIEFGAIADAKSLEHVFLLGEALRPELVRRSMTSIGASLYNGYGLTEASPLLFWKCKENDPSDDLPIGLPAPASLVILVDEEGNCVEGPGEGELLAGGLCLMEGYVGSEGDQGRLISIEEESDFSRLLRTGDLVRRRSDGALVYRGRVDDQINIFGNRLNPVEVEAIIKGVSGVKEAIVHRVPSSSGGFIRAVIEAESSDTLPERVRDTCSRSLPAFGVPAVVDVVDELPRLPSGKVDRRAVSKERSAPRIARVTSDHSAIARLETLVEKVCERGGFDRNASLQQQGLTSLEMMRLLYEIEVEFAVEIDVASAYGEHDSIEGIAGIIELAGRIEN